MEGKTVNNVLWFEKDEDPLGLTGYAKVNHFDHWCWSWNTIMEKGDQYGTAWSVMSTVTNLYDYTDTKWYRRMVKKRKGLG